MAVKIRLKRMGSKRNPHYRLVVADSRTPRDGRFIEEIGSYHPRDNEQKVNVDEERALSWLANGAKPSNTVRNLFSELGIMEEYAKRKSS